MTAHEADEIAWHLLSEAPKAIDIEADKVALSEYMRLAGGRSIIFQSLITGPETMIKIKAPTIIEAAGNKPKVIEEFFGRVNSGTDDLSIARMQSPAGWIEPGQTPEFAEYSVVLKGMLRVATREGATDIHAGQAVLVPAGEWVQYSTPGSEGAEYIAVCRPAFSSETVHRDA